MPEQGALDAVRHDVYAELRRLAAPYVQPPFTVTCLTSSDQSLLETDAQ